MDKIDDEMVGVESSRAAAWAWFRHTQNQVNHGERIFSPPLRIEAPHSSSHERPSRFKLEAMKGQENTTSSSPPRSTSLSSSSSLSSSVSDSGKCGTNCYISKDPISLSAIPATTEKHCILVLTHLSESQKSLTSSDRKSSLKKGYNLGKKRKLGLKPWISWLFQKIGLASPNSKASSSSDWHFQIHGRRDYCGSNSGNTSFPLGNPEVIAAVQMLF